jgi:ATP-dependent Clp protease protease subunit
MPASYIAFSANVNQQTAQQLVAACALQANNGVDDLVLVLSTPGGQVDDGIMVYNVLKGLPCKVTTFNVGAVNSIGNAIFLAGECRYAAPGATFLFHGVGLDINGRVRLEEKNLTEGLQSVQVGQQKIGDIICSRTSIDTQEVRDLFFRQETKDTQFALDKGIIHEVRDFSIPKGAQFQQLVFANK